MSHKHVYVVEDPTEDALKAAEFGQRIYRKCILSPDEMGNWKRSCAYFDLIAYINNTSTAIQGYRQTGGYIITDQMWKLCKIFNWLERLVMECHPLGAGRGLMRCVGEDKTDTMASTISLHNKCHRAYRTWTKMVQEKIFSLLERQVKPNCKHINELAQYLIRSFGCLRGYDYGPVNELHFLFFLCGLFKSGILSNQDTISAALLLYQRYLNLVRRLMLFYRLSATHHRDHNAIDDRNVIPYIWGCAQLCRQQPFKPADWAKTDIMDKYHQDYMLLSSLNYLQKTMSNVELGVHAYQLWCVLSLNNWTDAYAGLMQTFLKHVLADFYTVQELIFSEMMSFDRQPTEYLTRAYLGELPPFDVSTSDDSAASVDEHVMGDEEQDDDDDELQHEEEPQLKDDQEQKLKRKFKFKLPGSESSDVSGMEPAPLRRHSSYKQIYFGYHDPHKPVEHVSDEHAEQLCYPRNHHHPTLQQSTSTMSSDHNIHFAESMSDVHTLETVFGIQSPASPE